MRFEKKYFTGQGQWSSKTLQLMVCTPSSCSRMEKSEFGKVHFLIVCSSARTDTRATPSEVLIQPLDVAVPGVHAGGEIRGPHGEDHAAVEAVVEVVEGDGHAGVLQALGVHGAVVAQHVVLAGQHVGARLPRQRRVVRQQRHRPHVQQRRQLLHDGRRARGLHDGLVALFEGRGQQGCPVEARPEGEGPADVERGVVVDQQLVSQVVVAVEVIDPVVDHDVAGKHGHVHVLLVRRCVEVERLEDWINQGLQFRSDGQILFFAKLCEKRRTELRLRGK